MAFLNDRCARVPLTPKVIAACEKLFIAVKVIASILPAMVLAVTVVVGNVFTALVIRTFAKENIAPCMPEGIPYLNIFKKIALSKQSFEKLNL